MLLHKTEWEPIRMSAFEIGFAIKEIKVLKKPQIQTTKIFTCWIECKQKVTGTAKLKLALQFVNF